MTSPLSRETWRLEAETDPEAFARYRAASAHMWDVELHEDEAGFHNLLEGYHLGGVLFARCRGVAQTFRRTRAHIARETGDNVQLVLCLSASAFHGDYDGRACHHGLGTMRVVDLLRPFELHVADYLTLNLMLPRSTLGAAGALDFHGLTLSEETAGGRLLADSLRSLWATIDGLSQVEAEAAARAIGALVAGVIQGHAHPANGADLSGLLLAQAQREVDAHLADPELSATHLVRRLAIGRSTAYRLFEPHGGVAAFIQARRLDRAFDALLADEDVSLSEIGYRHGFKSAAHFSRAFSTRFGLPPGQARKAGARHAPPSAAADPGAVFDWIRRL